MFTLQRSLSLRLLILFFSGLSPTDICSFFFFFNDTATTEIYTLSLHDALPIYLYDQSFLGLTGSRYYVRGPKSPPEIDRKSTRLNSSHSQISYAVFCLKKKNTLNIYIPPQQLQVVRVVLSFTTAFNATHPGSPP